MMQLGKSMQGLLEVSGLTAIFYFLNQVMITNVYNNVKIYTYVYEFFKYIALSNL